jgi:hypothetical protein
MKKLRFVMMFLVIILSLTACSESNETPGKGAIDSVPTIVQILEDAGYELTMHDDDAISYFQENTVDDLNAEATVTDLYMGYLDGNNWVQIIGLESDLDARNLQEAFENEDDEGQFVYQSGNTVVLTYTEETYNLFE